jgi:hypothetical protein
MEKTRISEDLRDRVVLLLCACAELEDEVVVTYGEDHNRPLAEIARDLLDDLEDDDNDD